MKTLFDDKTKKLLVGSSLLETDSLIRFYARAHKASLFGIEQATVLSLTSKIVLASRKYSSYEMLDAGESCAAFYAFLKGSIRSGAASRLIP